MGTDSIRSDLLSVYQAALSRMHGARLARQAAAGLSGPYALVALGKAAAAMTHGVLAVPDVEIVRGFVCTPHAYEQFDAPIGDWGIHYGGHPVPDDASFDAGAALVEWLAELPPSVPLLVLMSGGASSSIEHLREGVSRKDVITRTRSLLDSGADIHALNAARSEWSELKRGRAVQRAGLREVEMLVLSDVPSDDPAMVGSGPFFKNAASVHVTIIGTNRDLRAAARAAAVELGHVAVDAGQLRGDAARMARTIVDHLEGAAPGLYIWGGETTVALPDRHGRGGRCQHLALAVADALDGTSGIGLLAAGSDGVDGYSDDAGAVVDGGTAARLRAEGIDIGDALARADSGTALESVGALLHTGPTGTNLMDIVLALKSDP